MIESIVLISAFLSNLMLNISLESETLEQIVNTGILCFSVLLFILSINAYRKTRLKIILYASIAFILFTIQLSLEIVEDTINTVENPYNELVVSSITLSILVLFFLAIVRKS